MVITARDPGQRNKRVSIQRNTRAADTAGQLSNSWGEVAKRWAEITPVKGGESFKQHKMIAETDHVVFLTNDSITRAITEKDRIVWNGKTLSILSVYDVDLAGVEIMLQCKELK